MAIQSKQQFKFLIVTGRIFSIIIRSNKIKLNPLDYVVLIKIVLLVMPMPVLECHLL